MTLFQFIRDKWDLTCSIDCDVGLFGHLAVPFEIGWWIDSNAFGNKHWEVSFSVLCFTLHIELWMWKERISTDEWGKGNEEEGQYWRIGD